MQDVINLPPISLDWSEWFAWKEIAADSRGGDCVRVPNGQPGVYEAKYADAEERLTIGKASNLRMRVKQGLVKGKVPHSTGEKIRALEDLSRIVVRWARAERPAAVEEELHRRYRASFGMLPKYTQHT